MPASTSLSPSGTEVPDSKGEMWRFRGNAEVAILTTGIGSDLALDEVRVGPLCQYVSVQRRSLWNGRVRRSINVMAALVLLILASPIMLAVALAVRLSSPGPVLFTQPRVGLDRRRHVPGAPEDPRRKEDIGGKVFRIYKFRTMVHQPPEVRKEVWASQDDPRITSVGRILRKFRLDELPQLFNVIRGDMNLVGPRPEQPGIFQELRKEINGYESRQRVLPGITGLAQVKQSYDQSLDDVRRKVALDLTYVEEESPIRDVQIMAQTIPVVLFGRGAL